MTEAEIKLWYHLRNRNLKGIKFKRQQPIGKYIVDFISHEIKLIIEVDGSQHIENREYDRIRTQTLEKHGYRVIRLRNNDVLKNINSVIEAILDNLNNPLTLNPSPMRRRGRKR